MRQGYHHLRPSLVQKIDYSIALLKKAEPLAMKYDPENGFYLAMSFGKDSQCLYHVAQLAGVKFKAHFSPTSVDPPQLIRFGRTRYPDVEFEKIKENIWQVATKKKVLPSQLIRWCCAEFKEHAGAGKVTLLGIRREESRRRAKRNEIEMSSKKFSGDYDEFTKWQNQEISKKIEKLKKKHKNLNHDEFSYDKETEVKCISGKDSILVSPIIEWTEKDVWDFLNGMEIEHCELYDKGRTRIGCILCPMAATKEKLRDIKEFPRVKKNWVKAIMCIRNGTDFFGNQIVGSTPPILEKWPARGGGKKTRKRANYGVWGFLDSPADDSAAQQGEYTEEEIAEQIFDWWISAKPFNVWYAEKFLQQKLDFGDHE